MAVEPKQVVEKLYGELIEKHPGIFWSGGTSTKKSLLPWQMGGPETHSLYIMYEEGKELPKGVPREYEGYAVNYFTDY